MYYRFVFIFIFMLCLTVPFLPTSAREVKDTLRSDARDKVFITYDISYQNNDVTITFKSVRKKLADDRDSKYDLKDVRILFFERNGEFTDDKFTGDISTNCLREVKTDWEYERSEQGYVWIEPDTELKLHLHTNESNLSLPIYMAHYEKKHTYKIIADCRLLKISLKKNSAAGNHQVRNTGGNTVTRSETITTTEEVEPTNAEKAESWMNTIEDYLQQPLTASTINTLENYCTHLRELEFNIMDGTLRNRISGVLQKADDIINKYEQEKEIAGIQAEEAKQKETLLKDGRNNMDYLNDRLDNIDNLSESDLAELKPLANQLRRSSKDIKEIGSAEAEQLAGKMVKAADRCDTEMKKIEDAKKKRSLWLIIGGIVLVVLMFVGTQVLQHIRNQRNQKSIKDMQDKMTKQAKDETRRRLRNTVRSNMNHAESAIKQKSRNTVRNGLNNGINNIIKKRGGNSFTV